MKTADRKRTYFHQEEAERIIAEIRAAEKKTACEIRLHVENRCWRHPIKRAQVVFRKIGMQRTEGQTGLLIYLSMKSRKYAIIGDSGISEKVESTFFEEVRNLMQPYFDEEKFCEGVCQGIRFCGDHLAPLIPWQADDDNELSDDISVGE